MQIRIDLIAPSSRPVRSSWDEDKMAELAQSVKEQGVIVPIKVRPIFSLTECRYHGLDWLTGHQWSVQDDGGSCFWCNEARPEVFDESGDYDFDEEPVLHIPLEIVYGHRRVEAARRAGLSEIRAFVEGVDDDRALLEAGIENLQREDMAPLDEARWYRAIMEEYGWNQPQVGEAIGRDKTRVSQMLALLDEPPEIREMVRKSEGKPKPVDAVHYPVTETHVRQVRRAAGGRLNTDIKVAALKKAEREGLTAEQTRQVAESVAASPSAKRRQYLIDHPYSPYTHDPAYQRQREQQYGDHDVLLQDAPTRPADEGWIGLPSVKQAIDTIKWWERGLKDLREMAGAGKMAPEAKRFIAHRLESFAEELESLIMDFGN